MRTRTVVHLTLTESEEKTLSMWAGAGSTLRSLKKMVKELLLQKS